MFSFLNKKIFIFFIFFFTIFLNYSNVFAVSWDISSATFESQTASLGFSVRDVYVTSDGTKMYLADFSSTRIRQYTLNTPWDVTSLVHVRDFSTSSQGNPTSVHFNTTGTKMYILSFYVDRVYEYNLSTAWDISSAVASGVNKATYSSDHLPYSSTFSADGTSFYVADSYNERIYQHDLSTAWDLSTMTYNNKYLSVPSVSYGNYKNGIHFKPDGTKMYLVVENYSNGAEKMLQFTLSTPWLVSSATYDSVFIDLSSTETYVHGQFFKPDGTKFFLSGAGNNKMHQFTMTDTSGPAISSLAPQDGSNTFLPDGNLSIVFDEVVAVGTGNIIIKKIEDNSIIESIDITSGQITGFGTNTLTVDLSVSLLNDTAYYVQIDATAIDDSLGNSFAGISNNSTWNFFTLDITPPTVQASDLIFSSISYSGMSLSWTSGNGDERIVFAKAGNTGSSLPVDNTIYTANSVFGSGSQIGSSGWYVVYKGTGNSVSVTGLSPSTEYIFHVVEYDFSGTNPLYLTDTAVNNPKMETSLALIAPTVQASQIVFSGVNHNSLTLNWTSGNGEKRVVFGKAVGGLASLPVENTTYTANSVFGSGSQIGSSGWYAVYNNAGNSVTVTGLSPETYYAFFVFEYNGASGQEKYFTDTNTNNPKSTTTLEAPPLEDFEVGDFSNFDWVFGGNLPWVVTTGDKYAGTYSAKAGTITHSQSSFMEVTLDIASNGNISYYRKVSSEGCCDYLRFYIDGVQKESISGAGSWGQVSYAVTAGTRTFKWVYSKDGSVNSGSDTAWVDNILFPEIVVSSYTLNYLAGANGSLSGTASQTVSVGGNGSAIQAIPDSGYSFINWSDSSTENPRTDTNVSANISVTANFADITNPIISNINTTSLENSIIFNWETTNELSSSKVEYGPSIFFGAETDEINTSPRVSSHEVLIENLPVCTTVFFRLKSKDASNNEIVSDTSNATTSGCVADVVPVSSENDFFLVENGGEIIVENNDNDAVFTIPQNFSNIASAFQIKKMNKTDVLLVVSKPSGYTEIGPSVFEAKSIDNSFNIIQNFSSPVSVSIFYTEEDISGLDEDSLKIFRWNGSSWNELSSCVVDKDLQKVTCSTSSFSVFGLFGISPVVSTVSSNVNNNGSVSVVLLQEMSDRLRKEKEERNFIEMNCKEGYLFSPINGQPCPKVEMDDKNLIESNFIFTKDLKFGIKDEEVKKLQEYLNKKGFILTLKGVGSPGNETDFFGLLTDRALRRFQDKYKVEILLPFGFKKNTGYLGPATRNFINNNY